MNKKTYEALKRFIGIVELMTWHTKQDEQDIKTINVWIDKVAIKYKGKKLYKCYCTKTELSTPHIVDKNHQ